MDSPDHCFSLDLIILEYGKQGQQEKAAFNERNPYTTLHIFFPFHVRFSSYLTDCHSFLSLADEIGRGV
jgi:hypothetical protein